MQKFDILVAGEINPDLILAGDVQPEFGQVEKLLDSATLTIGSSSAIFACGAARLGLKVGFIGVCGEDVFGRFMLEEMSRRGLDIENVIVHPGGSTGLSVILNRASDRAILTHPGLMAELTASDVSDALLQDARHLHVASYFLQTNLQPDLPALFRRAHSFGLTTSLDTNYDPSEGWLGFDELLSVTDVFLPNKTEALSITKSSDLESAARGLAEKMQANDVVRNDIPQVSGLAGRPHSRTVAHRDGVRDHPAPPFAAKVVAVKLGAEGALACHNKDSVTRASSISVNVVDTVGAGDSFDAGFLYGYLNAWPVEKSLRLACVCGALSTQQAGGTAGQPTLEEAMRYVS
ncbi:MAG TPA: carbohydrate kinase family protein [Anaerolineales bacterium]|nr:carbohydrate kinase family protein [Anaerolineales bacterium]